MKNVFHKKKWNAGIVQVHVDPPLIPLIKSRNKDKSDKGFVKMKLCRDPTSENSDVYEFRIDLFDNGESEEFLLFVCYFNMTLVASRMFNTGANIQYLHMLVRGEALRQFDMLSAEVRSATSENLTFVILGFCA